MKICGFFREGSSGILECKEVWSHLLGWCSATAGIAENRVEKKKKKKIYSRREKKEKREWEIYASGEKSNYNVLLGYKEKEKKGNKKKSERENEIRRRVREKKGNKKKNEREERK